jgi:hypothetical protein
LPAESARIVYRAASGKLSSLLPGKARKTTLEIEIPEGKTVSNRAMERRLML